jgi:hypothetical protein
MLNSYLKADPDKLRLVTLKVPTSGYSESQKSTMVDIMSALPQIYYYSIPIPLESVDYCYVSDTSFLPTFSISFTDTTNIMTDVGYPADDGIISIVIPSRSNTIASIRTDFKITNYKANPTGGSRSITLSGVISVDGLYTPNYKSYISNSWETLKDIAQECGMGYLSNITSTDDTMNWINSGKKTHTFITKDIMPYGWVGESGFVWSFVDLFYNLNYVDVEVALLEDARERKTLLLTTGITATNKESTKLSPLVLTNDGSYASSNLYFIEPEILNQSTKVSIENGYRKCFYGYDIFGNWSDRAGLFQEFMVDSITTPGVENNSVILKGRPGDTQFFNNNISKYYFGAFDTDNVHPNYGYAAVQNEQNIAELQKVAVSITLPNPNLEIRRFDKVMVIFANNQQAADGKAINERMTGQWLVTGITYEMFAGKITQKLTLVKRELNVTDPTL